jgi:hypothetical protein
MAEIPIRETAVHGIPCLVRFGEIVGVPGFFDFLDDLHELVVVLGGEESVGQVTRDCEMDTPSPASVSKS